MVEMGEGRGDDATCDAPGRLVPRLRAGLRCGFVEERSRKLDEVERIVEVGDDS